MRNALLKSLFYAAAAPFPLTAHVAAQESRPQKTFLSCLGEPPKRVCKYGFKDEKGVEVIAPQFEHARDFADGLAVVIIDKRFGYIGGEGRVAIAPQFEHAEDFSEGLAAVQVNRRWGFIDKSGKIVIAPEYDGVGRFSEGLAMVHNESERPPSGYIDKSGALVLKNKEAEFDFSEGLVPIAKRRFGFGWWLKYGFMDRTGKFVIKPRFDDARPFKNGVASVAKGCGPRQLNEASACKWFYIDRNGKVIEKPKEGSPVSAK
ncbi:MAG TPA: WG repeat-containing protein [Pyrinomonadaceae bacterium]